MRMAGRTGPVVLGSSTATTTHAERGLRLAELILAEAGRVGLDSGGRLPTERQLAADLGTTRSAVRHALAILQAQGRISREVGRGTFLRDAPPAAPAAHPGPPGGTSAEPGEGAAA